MADTNDPSSAPPGPAQPGYGYGYSTGEPKGTRTLRDYWRVLVQRRWVVYTCLIAVVSVTMLLTFFTTPIYEASTTIQIERQGPDILTHKDVMSADSSAYAYQDFYQTQYRILQSKSVVQIAAQRLDLTTRPEFLNRKPSMIRRAIGGILSPLRSAPKGKPLDPAEAAVRFVQGGMSVQPIRNSQLVAITFRDRDPELAREIADAIAEAYVAFNYKNKYGTTELALEFLTKEVAQTQLEIATQQRRLQEYGDKKKILAVSEGSQDISEQALSDLSRRYIESKSRRAIAQARYENAVGAAPESLPEVLNSTLISNLKQQYAELERKYSQMSERFKEGWPPLMQVRQELEQAQLRLQQETLGIAAQVQSVAKADFDRARSEMEHLEVQVNSQKSEVQRVNRDAVDYTGLQAEIDAKRKILSDLMARQTQTSSSERLNETTASNVRIVDKAELPIAPVSPRKILSFLSALASGLLLGVAMAFGIDHLDDTIKDEADIGRAGATVVLGYIPLFQPLRSVEGGTEDGKGDETNRIDLAAHIDSRSAFSEAFKNLRTSILLASPTGAPVRIAVTSCEPQDGKSTVSINLAIVLTQLGRRVLLVDADLRRPRVHRSFDIDNVIGFSSVLTANAELDECIQETAIPNLRVLPSGPIPPNPSELLGSQRMTEVLDSLRDKFDHIILDSPPVLSVTDPVLLSTRVDATIMVVRMGKTRRDGLALAAARLSQAHVRTPCTVLNGVDERSKHYYYYGGYRNYRADDASPGPSRKRDTRRTSAGA